MPDRRLKPDPDFDAAARRANDVAAAELRQFVERYEHLAQEKAELAAQHRLPEDYIAALLAEAPAPDDTEEAAA